MGISPYFARIRAAVGSELILIPGASVLPWDEECRLLLVRNKVDGPWGLIGGAVEPDESPHEAALREAFEEVGIQLEITGLRAVLGGPAFRFRYENGDEVAYVQTLFDARITAGVPTPDLDEVTEARWFSADELTRSELDGFARATLIAVELIPNSRQ
jgi:8-oxo-dGTP pyrophosphatase MutT (NUDIX family)